MKTQKNKKVDKKNKIQKKEDNQKNKTTNKQTKETHKTTKRKKIERVRKKRLPYQLNLFFPNDFSHIVQLFFNQNLMSTIHLCY